MSKLVVMPKLGLTMSEGKVSKWHKKQGDNVKAGEVIFEVETDKLTNDVVADQDGILRKVFVQEGETVLVTDPVAIIANADEDISDLDVGASEDIKAIDTDVSENKEEIKKVASTIRREGEYVKSTPYAKKLAKEKEIDLAEVVGTGVEGRVLAKNVLDYKDENRKKTSPTAAKMAKELGVDINTIDSKGRIMKEDILSASGMMDKAVGANEKLERVAPSSMRKVISKRMLQSWTSTPGVTFNIEVDVTNMKEFREKLKESFKKEGTKLSYNHILMKIASKVLLEVPYLNASFDGEEIEYHYYTNIGLAVAVREGLLVPNVKNIQDKSLLDIAVNMNKKVAAAQNGTLSPDDLAGGTFTITNIGMYGIDSFSPIINKPEVAILGVNRVVDKPVVVDGEVVIRPIMNLSLTADHRLVDGAMAAQFLARFKEVIQNPYLLLM